MGTSDIASLVIRLYEAALEPRLWPAAWAEATAAARGGPHLIVAADGGSPARLGGPGWARHAVAGGRTAVAMVEPGPDDAPLQECAARAEPEGLALPAEHLRQALQLRAQLARADAVQAAMGGALAAAGLGVVVVTAGGRLVHSDAGAARLAADAGLRLHARAAVEASEPAATQHLHDLIQDAVAGGSGGDMLLRGRDVLVAVAVGALEGTDGGKAVLRLQRLGQAHICPRRVSALFGMTRAEADVAVAVAAGQPVAAVATGRRVAESTVQSQVRSALGKAGVHGVAELGALFARLG